MADYDQKVIGNQIKKYRLAKNLSQRELSKLSGVSSGYIGDLERGNRKKNSSISLEYICKIADVLGVSLDDLAGSNLEYRKYKNTAEFLREIIEIEQEIETMPYGKLALLKEILSVLKQ